MEWEAELRGQLTQISRLQPWTLHRVVLSPIISRIQLKFNSKKCCCVGFWSTLKWPYHRCCCDVFCVSSPRRKTWSYMFLIIVISLYVWGVVTMGRGAQAQRRSSCQRNGACCFIHTSGKEQSKQIKSISSSCCNCLPCLQTFDPGLEAGLGPVKKRAITLVTQSQLRWNR